MELINLDDFLTGEDFMQWSDLIADSYASDQELIMIEKIGSNYMKDCGSYQSGSGFIYCTVFGFRDNLEHPLVEIALYVHLDESGPDQPRCWRWTICGWSYRGGFRKCRWGETGANDAYMLLFISENMLVLAE